MPGDLDFVGCLKHHDVQPATGAVYEGERIPAEYPPAASTVIMPVRLLEFLWSLLA